MLSRLFGISQLHPASSIPGFLYKSDAVSVEEELEILRAIDASNAPWTRRRTRLTKNYGPYYVFNERDTEQGRFRYTNGEILYTDLPEFLEELLIPIVRRSFPQLFNEFQPNQVHVAMYGEGDRIRMHNDNKMGELGDWIVGVSLKGRCDMSWENPNDNKTNRKLVRVERRSIYIMSGDSHRIWRHGILNGHSQAGRVSITMRQVVGKLAVKEGFHVKKSRYQPSEEGIRRQMDKDERKRRGETVQFMDDIRVSSNVDM